MKWRQSDFMSARESNDAARRLWQSRQKSARRAQPERGARQGQRSGDGRLYGESMQCPHALEGLGSGQSCKASGEANRRQESRCQAGGVR